MNKNNLIQKIPAITAYCTSIYFIEIIIYAYAVSVLYNKIVAVLFALGAAILLSIHIIRLYTRYKSNRLIQVILIDIHFILNLLYFFIPATTDFFAGIFIAFTIYKVLLVIIDITLFFFLTNEKIKPLFTK